MYHAREGYLAATNELLSLHIDTRRRRSTPFPDDLLARWARIHAGHAALPRPPEAGPPDGDPAPAAGRRVGRAVIRIWGRPTSICTQRVLWACVEAGVEFDLSLASGTMGPKGHVSTGAEPYGHVDQPWYLAMNPNGTVPVIDDGGYVLWESNAVVTYLALRYGSRTLLDGRPETLARAIQWMSWTNEHLEPGLHTLVMELSRLREDLRTPGAAEQADVRVAASLEVLEAQLARTPFLLGDDFFDGRHPGRGGRPPVAGLRPAGPRHPARRDVARAARGAGRLPAARRPARPAYLSFFAGSPGRARAPAANPSPDSAL